MVNIKIEGVSYQVEEGLTILEAAKKCGYEIPSLCAFNHGECNHGSCRVCLVEVVGAREGVFNEWRKGKGKLGGQHKGPRLSNNRQHIDELLLMNKR